MGSSVRIHEHAVKLFDIFPGQILECGDFDDVVKDKKIGDIDPYGVSDIFIIPKLVRIL